MIAREDDRTALRQILQTCDLHITVQRDLIKADKRDGRPALCPYLARVATQRKIEETDRRQRQQTEEDRVSSGVFWCQCLFNMRNAAANDRPSLFRRIQVGSAADGWFRLTL